MQDTANSQLLDFWGDDVAVVISVCRVLTVTSSVWSRSLFQYVMHAYLHAQTTDMEETLWIRCCLLVGSSAVKKMIQFQRRAPFFVCFFASVYESHCLTCG